MCKVLTYIRVQSTTLGKCTVFLIVYVHAFTKTRLEILRIFFFFLQLRGMLRKVFHKILLWEGYISKTKKSLLIQKSSSATNWIIIKFVIEFLLMGVVFEKEVFSKFLTLKGNIPEKINFENPALNDMITTKFELSFLGAFYKVSNNLYRPPTKKSIVLKSS